MARRLDIGESLSLPLEVVTSKIGMLGVPGSGKSNAMAVLGEQLYAAQLPFVFIDPEGSGYGFRAGADGKPGGLAVPIFGGERGDVPLEPEGGKALARAIAERNMACVVDLSMMGTDNRRQRFLVDFVPELIKRNNDPMMVICEEADVYIKQSPRSNEGLSAQVRDVFLDAIQRGRKKGLGFTIGTQRSALVSKTALFMCETLMVFRTIGPGDIAVVRDWMRYHSIDENMLGSLPHLKPGECWVWSPFFLRKSERVLIHRRTTFDSGATPKVHAKRKVATLADIDLGALRETMAAAIERAKAEDPKLLQQRIVELEQQLKRRSAEAGAELMGDLKRARQRVTTLETNLKLQARSEQQRTSRLFKLAKEFVRLLEVIPSFEVPPSDPDEAPELDKEFFDNATLVRPGESLIEKVVGDGELPKGERAILVATAQYPQGVTRSQLTVLTSYKRRTRDAYIQRLMQRGYLEDRQRLHATQAGIAALGNWQPLPTGKNLLAWWLGRLPKGEAEVLRAIVAGVTTRIAITNTTGYKRRTRDAYIQRLAAKQLVNTSGHELALSQYIRGE